MSGDAGEAVWICNEVGKVELSNSDIEHILAKFWRRAEAARAAGGISKKDQFEGATIPDGWVLDYQIDYWLPPNVVLL